MFLSLIFLQILLTFAAAKEISGVFTSFNSLKWRKGANYRYASPAFPSWIAELGWKIDGSKMSAGDTFTLTMPCVFKFTTTQVSVNLKVGNTIYATCRFAPGDILLPTSELKCSLSDTVKQSTSAHGTMSFPLTFNVGGSALDTDVKCGETFTSGVNTVSFSDGDNVVSTTVNFEGGVDTNPDRIAYNARVVPSVNKLQHQVLGGKCGAGYSSGVLGITMLYGTGSIDCSSIHAAISNSLNDWYFPKSIETDFSYTTKCSATSFIINYKNIPAGYRVFIDTLVSSAVGVKHKIRYTNRYKCANSPYIIDNSETVQWQPYCNDVAGANGKEVELVTETWTGSTTLVYTKPFKTHDPTITIVVDVPIPTITYTTTYTGISTSYTTYTVTPGETASVVEYEPVHATTSEVSCWETDSTATTTIIVSTRATDTVLVITPCPKTKVETTTKQEQPITTDKPEPTTVEQVTSEEPEPTTVEQVTSEEPEPTTVEQVTSKEPEPTTVEQVTSEEPEPTTVEQVTSKEPEPTTVEQVTPEEPESTEVIVTTDCNTPPP
ncbi:uncharacterized protein SPAPADRAFT_146555, partial [Spathaspora passalidarum NRRL Y-27907]